MYLCTVSGIEPLETKKEKIREFLAVSVYDVLVKEGEVSKREFMKLSKEFVVNPQYCPSKETSCKEPHYLSKPLDLDCCIFECVPADTGPKMEPTIFVLCIFGSLFLSITLSLNCECLASKMKKNHMN